MSRSALVAVAPLQAAGGAVVGVNAAIARRGDERRGMT